MPSTQEKANTSNEIAVAVTSSTELSEIEAAQLDEFESYLMGEKDPPEIEEDPEAVARQIMRELLNAKSDEELQSFGNAIGWRELAKRYVSHHGLPAQEGTPIMLRDFGWRPSTFEDGDGLPVFVVVHGVRLDTGEQIALTTGAGSVMAQLLNMKRRGVLSGAVWMATEGEKPTASKNYPMHLVKVDQEEIGRLRRVVDARAAVEDDSNPLDGV